MAHRKWKGGHVQFGARGDTRFPGLSVVGTLVYWSIFMHRVIVVLLILAVIMRLPWAFASDAGTSIIQCPRQAGDDVTICQGYGTYRHSDFSNAAVNLVLAPQPGIDSQLADLLSGLAADQNVAWPDGQLPYLAFGDTGLELHFAFAQRTVRDINRFSSVSSGRDDNVAIYLAKPGDEQNTLVVTMNPNGKCSSRSYTPQFVSTHDQCESKLTPSLKQCPQFPLTNGKPPVCWAGTLSVPFRYLGANGLLSGMRVRIARVLWVHDPQNNRDYPVTYLSGGSDFTEWGQWTAISTSTSQDVASERFIQGGPNTGYVQNGKKGTFMRIYGPTANLYFPLTAKTLFAASFGDQSSSLLTLRDSALSDVFGDAHASKLACVSCGSFQTDASTTGAWKPVVTSVSILGIDLKLGVDSSAFSFKAASFPIDSGYKFITENGGVGIAVMNGATDSQGVARDAVLAVSSSFGADGHRVTVGLLHANANRSLLPTPSAGSLYNSIFPSIQHSSNSEISVGYTKSSGASALGDSTFTTGRVGTFGALFRYGSQYQPGSQRLDLAVSNGFEPGYSDFERALVTRDQWKELVGYRTIGANYSPIDASFDPLLGLHGFYGALQHVAREGSPHPLTITLSFHRFSDSIEARDTAVTGTAKIGLWSGVSFTANGTISHLAVSQVARQTAKIIVPDQAGGALYLPNSSYGGVVAYDAPKVSANIGYSYGYAQNCDKTQAILPCVAYGNRKPDLTYGLFLNPSGSLFLTWSLERDNNAVFANGASVLTSSGSSHQTTADHLIRKYGFGFEFPKFSCASLTFTTVNRGGEVDSFAAGPPQPGSTTTAALDIPPSGSEVPGLLVAYSRSSTLGDPGASSQFFARVLLGLPEAAIAAQTKQACAR
jgi:hypothetical protein